MESFESIMSFERQVNEHRLSVLVNHPGPLKIVCTATWIKAYVRESVKYRRLFNTLEMVYKSPKEKGYEKLQYPDSIQGMDVEINDVQSVDFLVTKA